MTVGSGSRSTPPASNRTASIALTNSLQTGGTLLAPPPHELGRHLPRCLVDHLVAEHDRALALALGRRLLVGVEDVPRAVELLLRRREELVEDVDLVGVQRPLAVVAEHLRALAVVAERVGLADLQERAVDHLEAVRPTRHQDLREHVVEVVARVLGDLHAAGEHRHLHRRGEVGGTEDDGLEARRRRADLLDVDEAAASSRSAPRCRRGRQGDRP